MKEKGITTFGETKIIFQDKKLLIENKYNSKERDKIISITTEILSALNSIEAFSVFFTSQVADSDVAYSSIGNTYCNSIKKLLPVICLSQGEGFTNIIKLYVSWNDKIEKQKALQEKLSAEAKLKKNSSIDFKSLGT
ncbi:hypothetical protein [Paenibacillus sp. FSL P2-0173]